MRTGNAAAYGCRWLRRFANNGKPGTSSVVARVQSGFVASSPPRSLSAPRGGTTTLLARCFAGSPNNETINTSSESESYSQLLTRATARQLKGDIPEAIVLTSQALLILRDQQLAAENGIDGDNERYRMIREDLADALFFLGKLLQLQNNVADAVRSFEEARWIFHERHQQETEKHAATKHPTKAAAHASRMVAVALRKRECATLSHLAEAQARMWLDKKDNDNGNGNDDYEQMQQWLNLAEANFEEALDGLASSVGWEDGMTHHTAHRRAMLCKERGRFEEAIGKLTVIQNQLADIFGPDDPKVVQLNGELADLWQLRSSSSSSSSSSGSAKARALLEEALETLPPNSPEARRIFMRLEELEEAGDEQGPGIVTVTKGHDLKL